MAERKRKWTAASQTKKPTPTHNRIGKWCCARGLGLGVLTQGARLGVWRGLKLTLCYEGAQHCNAFSLSSRGPRPRGSL